MSQNDQHGAGDQSVPLSAYCIQCLTGREEKTAYLIEQAYPQITAYAVRQHKHQSTGGVKTIVTKILLPGYIFLYTRGEVPFRRLLSMQEVSRFLSYGGKDDYQLCGADLQFATWVMRHEGLFQCSRAVQVGSENLINPFACPDIIQALPEVMAEYGITNLTDIIGGAH